MVKLMPSGRPYVNIGGRFWFLSRTMKQIEKHRKQQRQKA